jgi:hypothetical protein
MKLATPKAMPHVWLGITPKYDFYNTQLLKLKAFAHSKDLGYFCTTK